MIKFDFVPHLQLTNDQIEAICELKSQYWKYPIESQKAWLNNNFSSEDVHLFLYNESTFIGYLSLVKMDSTIIDESNLNLFGLGSVCVSLTEKGKNYGLLLMYLVSFYLKSNKAIGILLCKEELVSFYNKAGWSIFQGDVTINLEEYNYYLMSTRLLSVGSINLPFSF